MGIDTISEQEIREQLELILGDAAFSASNRLKIFFRRRPPLPICLICLEEQKM